MIGYINDHQGPCEEPSDDSVTRSPSDAAGELLPCPRCGNHAFVTIAFDVWCSQYMCLKLPPRASRAEAIAAWNTRATRTPDQAASAQDGERETGVPEHIVRDLMDAAKAFVRHWQPWMDETDATEDGGYNHADADEMSVFARVTYGDLRRLRAALRAVDAPPKGGVDHSSDVRNMVPAGWKLVPIEPTEAMLDAMHASILIRCDPSERSADIQNDRAVWFAMLAAAPSPTADPAPNADVQGLVEACNMLLWFQRHEHTEVSEAHEAWDALDAALAAFQAASGKVKA